MYKDQNEIKDIATEQADVLRKPNKPVVEKQQHRSVFVPGTKPSVKLFKDLDRMFPR